MNGPKATATMRVDDLLQQHQQQHQFYVNPTHHNPMTNQHHQQQAQYSNIGSQNCKFVKANHRGRHGSALLFLADLLKYTSNGASSTDMK